MQAHAQATPSDFTLEKPSACMLQGGAVPAGEGGTADQLLDVLVRRHLWGFADLSHLAVDKVATHREWGSAWVKPWELYRLCLKGQSTVQCCTTSSAVLYH